MSLRAYVLTPLDGTGQVVPLALSEVVQAVESVASAWKLLAEPAVGAWIVNPQRIYLLSAYLPEGLSTEPVV